MDSIYLITGLITVIGAIGGLALTCHLERRSLGSRRSGGFETPAEEIGAEGQPT